MSTAAYYRKGTALLALCRAHKNEIAPYWRKVSGPWLTTLRANPECIECEGLRRKAQADKAQADKATSTEGQS